MANKESAQLSIEPVNAGGAGNANTNLPYEQFGIIPGVAQRAQAALHINPHLDPQPVFSALDHAAAHWFTTRVHLSPLGHAHERFAKDKRGITTNV